jgi:hypothetical protein
MIVPPVFVFSRIEKLSSYILFANDDIHPVGLAARSRSKGENTTME